MIVFAHMLHFLQFYGNSRIVRMETWILMDNRMRLVYVLPDYLSDSIPFRPFAARICDLSEEIV